MAGSDPVGELGWTGVSARVDLSSGRVQVVSTAELRGPFPGERSAGQRVVLREVPPGVGPLDPENRFVLSAGPLVGTGAPASARISVDTKGAVTGGVSSSNAGGYWASELKFAGFDMLVVHGRAPRPVYLLVEEGRVTLQDARPLWGKSVWETEAALRQDHGDDRLQLLSIGPAGERLVPIACVMVGRGRAAGHGGCGAVMGSKNLKAIACRGSRPVKIASPATFQEAVRGSQARLEASRAAAMLREGGTHLRSGAGGLDGKRPTGVRNSQDECWTPERAAMIREPVLREQCEVGRLACFNCPLYCSHYYRVSEGPYAGLACEGMQANAVRGFGSNLDVTDPVAILKANALCNEYGLDVDGAANGLAWAFELFERGLLTTADTDGLELRWGDHLAMNALLERVALGTGLGTLLEQGVGRAAERLGRGSAYYGLTNKGHDLSEAAMRSHKGWALGILTSTRGGGHLNGAPSTEFQGISRETSRRFFGVDTAGVPEEYEGKAEVLVYFERLKAVVDSLGMCYFTSQWSDLALLGPEEYAALYGAATGDERTGEDLMGLGERLVSLERHFNRLHAGFGRREDYPPERLVREPIRTGPYAGQRLDLEHWDRMLDRYYALHGWDLATGWPGESVGSEP